MADGGNIIQTFLLMFKTNSAQVEKDMKSVQKVSDETAKKIKGTKEETNELGKAFTSMVETGEKALAAYGSFTAIKSGLLDAQQFNRALTIQSNLWGQNSNKMAAWSAAIQQAGGNGKAFLGWYNQLQLSNAQQFRQTLPLDQIMKNARGQIKGLQPDIQRSMLLGMGIPQDAWPYLMQGDKAFEESNKHMEELTANTDRAAASSQQFGTAWDNMTTALRNSFTVMGIHVLPVLTNMERAITDLANSTALLIDGKYKDFFSSLLSAAPNIGQSLGGVSGRAMGIYLNKKFGSGKENGPPPGFITGVPDASSGSKAVDTSSAMNYLMSKYGWDANHAAAAVANMIAESGGNMGAIGDGGLARGGFQWHPDRAAAIKASTGIDVGNASMFQNLDAMVGELKTRPEYGRFMAATNASDAGSIFSSDFEVARGMEGRAFEAMRRGNAAMELAGSVPFSSLPGGGNSTSANVTIGQITVNTQATDAQGVANAVGGALQSHIRNVFSQNNDAVNY